MLKTKLQKKVRLNQKSMIKNNGKVLKAKL